MKQLKANKEDILTRLDMLAQSNYFTRTTVMVDRELDQFHDANDDVGWLIDTVKALLSDEVEVGSQKEQEGADERPEVSLCDIADYLERVWADTTIDVDNRQKIFARLRYDISAIDLLKDKLRASTKDLNIKELENAELRAVLSGILENDGSGDVFDLLKVSEFRKQARALLVDGKPASPWQPTETCSWKEIPATDKPLHTVNLGYRDDDGFWVVETGAWLPPHQFWSKDGPWTHYAELPPAPESGGQGDE